MDNRTLLMHASHDPDARRIKTVAIKVGFLAATTPKLGITRAYRPHSSLFSFSLPITTPLNG